jgi:hypothetical protein
LTPDEWQQVPLDPETVALLRLSLQAVDILEGPSSPFEKPRWVEDFEENRRRGMTAASVIEEHHPIPALPSSTSNRRPGPLTSVSKCRYI